MCVYACDCVCVTYVYVCVNFPLTGTHYVYHDEVCIITFSVASHMLKISEAVETLMHFITLLAIDLPTLTR